jgi:hypothetical protein
MFGQPQLLCGVVFPMERSDHPQELIFDILIGPQHSGIEEMKVAMHLKGARPLFLHVIKFNLL